STPWTATSSPTTASEPTSRVFGRRRIPSYDLLMRAFRLLMAAAVLALPACGGEPPPPAATPKPAAKPAPVRPASLPAGHLFRGDVDAALSKGPPWVLRRVPIEEVMRDGKFFGWRVVAMPPEWSDIDLKAGD